ncbi:MAG TPA: TlpA disulfide reductase family protein [Burkholderiaceae bacterium]|nr:TlpA disulfide reductase family protein [Burkholderiaceae bacterium]
MNRRDLLRAGMAVAAVAGSGPLAGMAHGAPVLFYDLEFPDMHGQSRAVSDFLGQPMVLNFWATWCPPCVREMPDLDYLQTKYPGVTVVGLAIDTADNVRKFSQKVPVDYPVLVAGHGGIQLMKEMGNPRGGLPYTILYDARGQELRHFLGQIDRDELDGILAGTVANQNGQTR